MNNIPIIVITTEPTPGEWEVVTTQRFNNEAIARAVQTAINAAIEDAGGLTVMERFTKKYTK